MSSYIKVYKFRHQVQILPSLEEKTRLEGKFNSLRDIPFLELLCTWVI